MGRVYIHIPMVLKEVKKVMAVAIEGIGFSGTIGFGEDCVLGV
jgi:hypothetical protein